MALCYLVHGGAYVLFSQASRFEVALGWIALSRAAVAVSSVLNWSLLLRHVAHDYRGRVFATNESLVWSTMMLSMLAAGIASKSVDPRVIGAFSGVLSSCTAIYWIWADRVGLLKEPRAAAGRGGGPRAARSADSVAMPTLTHPTWTPITWLYYPFGGGAVVSAKV